MDDMDAQRSAQHVWHVGRKRMKIITKQRYQYSNKKAFIEDLECGSLLKPEKKAEEEKRKCGNAMRREEVKEEAAAIRRKEIEETTMKREESLLINALCLCWPQLQEESSTSEEKYRRKPKRWKRSEQALTYKACESEESGGSWNQYEENLSAKLSNWKLKYHRRK